MGGRGSGGGKAGGGKASLGGAFSDIRANNNRDFNEQVKSKLSEMTDKELNRAIINTKNQMNNETVKLALEQNKLRKMNEEFRKVNMSDKDYESKSLALDKQISKVSEAQSRADIRTQIHYLAINEKYNVRDKQATNNIKSMTNGQLNSYYHKMYNTSLKSAKRIKNTNSPKTRSKYEKIFNESSNNFEKANSERKRRGLGVGNDAKNW